MTALSRRSFLAAAAGTAALAAAGGLAGCSSGDGKVHLELFQFKSEAINLFDRICADFNDANPDIVVTQNFQANNITSLRARLVKGDMPDLITINGDYNYGALTRTSIFYDFGRTALLDGVNPAFASILNTLGQGGEGQTNGLAFADNGSGIIYNKDVFAEAGLEPPTTWNELIGICDELTGRGINPFYWATKDNWTGAPAFSSLSGSFLTDGVAAWYAKRADLSSGTSFAELTPVFEKMLQAYSYGNSDKAGLGYNDGNQGFAQGKGAMYWHGTYAIPAIRSYNSDINLGTFATPADTAADTRVVSGVDVALTAIGLSDPFPAGSMDATASVGWDQLTTMVEAAKPSAPALSVQAGDLGTADDPGTMIASTKVFGIDASMTIAPAVADDGGLLLTVTSVTIRGTELDVNSTFYGRPVLSYLGLETPEISIGADKLPQGLSLDRVSVTDTGLSLTLSGSDVELANL